MSIPICLTFSCKLHILRILLSYKFQDINFGRVKKYMSSASFHYQLNIMAESQKRTSKRKPNWSDEELQIMLSCAREKSRNYTWKVFFKCNVGKEESGVNDITRQ